MVNKPSQTEEISELDRYERIVDRAHKEIEGVRTVYKWLFGCLTIIFVFGVTLAVIFIGKDLNAIKSRLNDEADTVSQLVKDRINEEFKQENIQSLVEEKAEARIEKITDQLISQQIKKIIDPQIAGIREEVKAQEEKLAKMIKLAEPPELRLSSLPAIQKVEAGYDVELKFTAPEDIFLGAIAFEVQVVDTSAAKILDIGRAGTGISLNVRRSITEDGKIAKFHYSPAASGLQQIKIRVSNACELLISGNYLAEPLKIVVK